MCIAEVNCTKTNMFTCNTRFPPAAARRETRRTPYPTAGAASRHVAFRTARPDWRGRRHTGHRATCGLICASLLSPTLWRHNTRTTVASVAVHPAHAGRPRHYALPSCDPAATSTCNSQRTEMRATQRRIALPPSRYTRASPSRALKTTPVRPLTSRPWTQTVGRRHRRIRAADASGTTYTLASRECTDEPRCASARSRASARSHHLSPSHASPLLHDPCFPQRARAASVVTPHHLRACPALLRPSLPTPRCRRHS